MKSQVEEREREESVWDEEAHTQLAVCLVFLKKNMLARLERFGCRIFNKSLRTVKTDREERERKKSHTEKKREKHIRKHVTTACRQNKLRREKKERENLICIYSSQKFAQQLPACLCKAFFHQVQIFPQPGNN